MRIIRQMLELDAALSAKYRSVAAGNQRRRN